MIKAIFFDYDWVLTVDKYGSYTTCRYLSWVTWIDFKKLEDAYIKFSDNINIGLTSHEKIWEDFCIELGENIDIKLLNEAFISTQLNDSIYNLIINLKKNYKTWLITDNKKDRMKVVTKSQKLDEIFDVIIVSVDVWSGKNNSLIFEKAVASLGLKFEECIFIDNQEKNLIIPNQLWMNTIFFDDEKKDFELLIKNLRDLNIKI